MADQPRRPGRPEGRHTLPIGSKVGDSPRITAPFASQRGPDDEPTRNLGSEEVVVVGGKFVDPADPALRTAVHSTVRTARDLPAAGRDPRDRLLPERATLPTNVVVTPALAADLPLPGVTMMEGAAPSPMPSSPREKTKIWVATHKPPVDPDPRLILLREPDSERAAAYRVLRHRLQQKSDPRVIVVTSAVAGEGKTTCAANLAMALGECERARVLLVEANLRTPSLAALFGFLPPTCFSVQLAQHRDKPLDPWAVVEAFSPSLHVLAVKPGDESRPLLDGPAFAHAMDMLRNAGYDYLVLDTPSVLGSADVNLVEDTCDGVLLCGWARRSSGRQLRRAVEQLSPAKILGITLLDV